MGCIEGIGFVLFLIFVSLANLETVFFLATIGIPVALVLFVLSLLGEFFELLSDIFAEYRNEIVRLLFVLYIFGVFVFIGQRWILPSLNGVALADAPQVILIVCILLLLIAIVLGFFATRPIKKDIYYKFQHERNQSYILDRIHDLSSLFATLYGVFYFVLFLVLMANMMSAKYTPERYGGPPTDEISTILVKAIVPLVIFIGLSIASKRR